MGRQPGGDSFVKVLVMFLGRVGIGGKPEEPVNEWVIDLLQASGINIDPIQSKESFPFDLG